MNKLRLFLLFLLFLLSLALSFGFSIIESDLIAYGVQKDALPHLAVYGHLLLVLSLALLSAKELLGGVKLLLKLSLSGDALYAVSFLSGTVATLLYAHTALVTTTPGKILLPTPVLALLAYTVVHGSVLEHHLFTPSARPRPDLRTIDAIAIRFFSFTLLSSFASALCWTIAGGRGLYDGLTIFFLLLSLASPIVYPIALPLAYARVKGTCEKHAITFVEPSVYELLPQVTTVVFDRAGTVTEARPFLSQIITEGLSEGALIGLAASLENGEHHLFSPIVLQAALERKARLSRLSAKNVYAGLGIEAIISGRPVRFGSMHWLEGEGIHISAKLKNQGDQAASKGKTCVYLATDKTAKGILVFTDELRHDTRRTVAHLKKMGIETLLLTGDGKSTAKKLAKDTGIDDYRSNLDPEGKAKEVQLLASRGNISLMLAAGESDATALEKADIRVRLAEQDTANTPVDIVLGSKVTTDLSKLLYLARQSEERMKVGLWSAFALQIAALLLVHLELLYHPVPILFPLYTLFVGSVGLAFFYYQILRLQYQEGELYLVNL